MARRPPRRPRGAPPPQEYEEYYDDRPPPSYFRRKRSSGNAGLYIALGLALLAGLIFLLFVTGGESDEEVSRKAVAALTEFMEICVDGRDAEGPDWVVAWEVMREDLSKKQQREYHTQPEEKRREVEQQAYKKLKYLIVPFRNAKGEIVQGVDMRIMNKSEIPTMLGGADTMVSEAGKRVDLEWLRNGRKWQAILRKSGEKWKIIWLDVKK